MAEIIPFPHGRRTPPSPPVDPEPAAVDYLKHTPTRQHYLETVAAGKVQAFRCNSYQGIDDSTQQLPHHSFVWYPAGGIGTRICTWLSRDQIRPLWVPTPRAQANPNGALGPIELTALGHHTLRRWRTTRRTH